MDGRQAVHALLLLGRHPALLHRAPQRGRRAVCGPRRRIPRADRRLHGRRGRDRGKGPARYAGRAGLLHGDRAAVVDLHARRHVEHVPARGEAALGRGDGRAVAAGGRARVHQLGPVRGRAGRGRASGLAGAPARAGRCVPRPRYGGEALPAAVLHPAAGAVLAGRAAAGVLAGGGRRGAGLGGGRRAGRAALAGLVAAVPQAQPGAVGRLRLALVRLPSARRQRQPDTQGQRPGRGRRPARAGRRVRAGTRGAAPAAASPAAVPRGRCVPAHQQGLEPAVFALAAAAGRAGPPVLAGATGLAGHRVPGVDPAAAVVPRHRREGRRLRVVLRSRAAA